VSGGAGAALRLLLGAAAERPQLMPGGESSTLVRSMRNTANLVAYCVDALRLRAMSRHVSSVLPS
jgi:hypothetical protein